MMNKLNRLSLPATILLASIILGGFYFAAEINKQKSIERQEQLKISEERRIQEEKTIAQNQKEASDALTKSICVNQAQASAQRFYKENCTYACHEGEYYIATYEHDYKTCLQAAGLE